MVGGLAQELPGSVPILQQIGALNRSMYADGLQQESLGASAGSVPNWTVIGGAIHMISTYLWSCALFQPIRTMLWKTQL